MTTETETILPLDKREHLYVAQKLRDAGYSYGLNQSRFEAELDDCREMISWLTDLDSYLMGAVERDFDLFLDDDPVARNTNRYRLVASIQNTVAAETDGRVSFPEDLLSKIRWATNLMKAWSIDTDTVNFTEAQASALYDFFLAVTIDFESRKPGEEEA